MSTQWQLRRDVAAIVNAGTPAPGEPWAITDWDNLVVIGDGSEVGGIPLCPLPRGYRDGGLLSLGLDAEHDITMGPGQFRAEGNNGDLLLPSGLTKQIDAPWAEGDNAGGFPSTEGTVAGTPDASTWYDVHVIGKVRNGTGDKDGGFSAANSAAAKLLTDASAYSYRRLLGSVLTDASTNITPFVAREDGWFSWQTPTLDINDTTPSTAPAGETYRLRVPPRKVLAQVLLGAQSTDGASIGYFRTPDQPDAQPVATNAAPLYNAGSGDGGSPSNGPKPQLIWTDDNGEIKGTIDSTAGSARLVGITYGWWDPLARDSA